MNLWEDYLEAEKAGVRKVTLKKLEEFLAELLSRDDWPDWARDLARQMAEEGSDIPVRRPLFRKALLPALLEGLTSAGPGSFAESCWSFCERLKVKPKEPLTGAGYPPSGCASTRRRVWIYLREEGSLRPATSWQEGTPLLGSAAAYRLMH